MASVTIKISFGAMARPIAYQLRELGFVLPMSKLAGLEPLQRQADAVVLLAIHGILPPAQVELARKRILKAIAAEVTP